MEFIKHLFGFCGEQHPSIIYLLSSVPFIGGVVYFWRTRITGVISSLKNRLGFRQTQTDSGQK
jgi:hypothetical protein